MVDLFEPLVSDIPMKNDVDFEVEHVLASPNQLIVDGESERVENKEVTFDIFEKNELLVENHPYMTVDMVDPLREGNVKENIMDLERNKEVKECVVSLEVKHIVLCVHSSSFFEDSAKYILQPQVHNPILLQ